MDPPFPLEIPSARPLEQRKVDRVRRRKRGKWPRKEGKRERRKIREGQTHRKVQR